MNKINVNQTGGFPLETDTLDFMQAAYHQLQAVAALGSSGNYILKDCIITGNSTGNGYVVINGEILEFRGGLTQTYIVIREESQNRPFENGQQKQVYLTRYATFGTGAGQLAWVNIIRIKDLSQFRNLPTVTSSATNSDREDTLATSKAVNELRKSIEATLLPKGSVIMWAGAIANIPQGWALCDGANGTPNLRGRFVVGFDAFSLANPSNSPEINKTNYGKIGNTGGTDAVAITVDQMPSHNHSFNDNTSQFGIDYGKGSTRGSNTNFSIETKTTDKTGGNQAHENRPPYYVLAYIIKL